MAKLSKEKYLVLMVDDSEDDCLLIKMAVSKADRLRFIGCVSDGEELVSYLTGKDNYSDRERYPLPDMLLLDLKMPELSGFEVLEWIRKRPEYAALPVIIFSSSSHPDDPRKAKTLGADDYWRKPANSMHYAQVVDLLRKKWLSAGPA